MKSVQEFFKSNTSNFGSQSPESSNSNNNKLPLMPCAVILFEPNTVLNELLNYVVIAFALYIAIKKCKINGQLNGSAIIIAWLFSPCFIAYRLIKPCM